MKTLQEKQKFVISLGVVTCIIGFGVVLAINSFLSFQTNDENEFNPKMGMPIPNNKIKEMDASGDSQASISLTIPVQNFSEMLIIQNVIDHLVYSN